MKLYKTAFSVPFGTEKNTIGKQKTIKNILTIIIVKGTDYTRWYFFHENN